MFEVLVVEEGTVAVTTFLGRHARVLAPGLRFLRPGEQVANTVVTRRTDRTLLLDRVQTHVGLPLTVHVRLTAEVDPARMHRDELYDSERERLSKLTAIVRRSLERVVASMPRLKSAASPDLDELLSPFEMRTKLELGDRLAEMARPELADHGLILSGPVDINGWTVPQVIGDAYNDLIKHGFSAAAMADVIRRVRAAAPEMSEAGLNELFHLVQNPTGAMRAMLQNGWFAPGGVEVQPARPPVRQPERPQQGSSRDQRPEGGATPVREEPPPGLPIVKPLTPDDMELLRPL